MSDYRLIMGGLTALCGLGFAATLWPAVERVVSAVTVGLLIAAGLVVAGYLAREARREWLFRAEMRALDARDAAREAARSRVGVRR